ncbi:MAG: LuxR C-terminal-related transcriptional regulator [Nitriliruptorales bacterium]|nr:LuxR C-terminal-related transcriptional regulator [Nitriliruptorales bacterium]
MGESAPPAPSAGRHAGASVSFVQTRVLLAHGDAVYATGLGTLLTDQLGIAVEVASPDAVDLHERLRDSGADVVVLELDAPGALLTMRAIRDQHPEVGIVAVGSADEDRRLAAIGAGAAGVLGRSVGSGELAALIAAALHDRVSVDRDSLEETLARRSARRDLLTRLDEERLVLLQQLASGATIAELGEVLFVSPRTVKRRLADLYDALGVPGRTEAVVLGGWLGLCDPPETAAGTVDP